MTAVAAPEPTVAAREELLSHINLDDECCQEALQRYAAARVAEVTTPLQQRLRRAYEGTKTSEQSEAISDKQKTYLHGRADGIQHAIDELVLLGESS